VVSHLVPEHFVPFLYGRLSTAEGGLLVHSIFTNLPPSCEQHILLIVAFLEQLHLVEQKEHLPVPPVVNASQVNIIVDSLLVIEKHFILVGKPTPPVRLRPLILHFDLLLWVLVDVALRIAFEGISTPRAHGLIFFLLLFEEVI